MYPALQVNSLPLSHLGIPVSGNSLFIGSFNEISRYFCLNNHYWLTTKSVRKMPQKQNNLLPKIKSSRHQLAPRHLLRENWLAQMSFLFLWKSNTILRIFSSPRVFCSLLIVFSQLVCVLSLQSYPTVYDPMDCSLQNSSVHEILQDTGVGCHILLQGNLPDPEIEPASLKLPALAGGFFTTSTTCWNSLNWYPILFNLLEITFGIQKAVLL